MRYSGLALEWFIISIPDDEEPAGLVREADIGEPGGGEQADSLTG